MAWDESLNTRHISSNYSAYESGRSGFFVFYVPKEEFEEEGVLYKVDFNRDGSDSPSETDYFDSSSVAEAFKLNVVKTSVPNFTLEEHTYRRGNDQIHFASVPTYGDGSLTLDDLVGLNTKEMAYAWLHKAYDPVTRKGGRMSEYKKTAYLIEYTQDHVQIRYWELEGCWIKSISEDDFDKENDGKRQLQISFRYDRAVMHSDEIAIAD